MESLRRSPRPKGPVQSWFYQQTTATGRKDLECAPAMDNAAEEAGKANDLLPEVEAPKTKTTSRGVPRGESQAESLRTQTLCRSSIEISDAVRPASPPMELERAQKK
jgi:hypothetical protein